MSDQKQVQQPQGCPADGKPSSQERRKPKRDWLKWSLLGPRTGAPSAPTNSDPMFLFGLMEDVTPLEMGYEEAARRGQPGPTRTCRVFWVGVAVVCGLLLGGAANAMRELIPGDDAYRVEIQDLKDLEAQNAEQREYVGELEVAVDDLAGRALRDEELKRQWEEDRAEREAVVTRGWGIQIILNDPPDGGSAAEQAAGVIDKDLQVLVNALWSVGAEEISINNQRVVGSTAIRVAAGIVGVNYQPISGPYVITALGKPRDLIAGFRESGGERYLQELRDEVGVRYKVEQGASYEVPAGPVKRGSGGAEGTVMFAKPLTSDGNHLGAGGYGEEGMERTP